MSTCEYYVLNLTILKYLYYVSFLIWCLNQERQLFKITSNKKIVFFYDFVIKCFYNKFISQAFWPGELWW